MHLLGGREIVKDYNQIWFHEGVEQRIAKLEMWLAKQIGVMLMETYPNRQWGVDVDITGAMIVITAPGLSLNHGYHVHIREGEKAPALVQRCKMGGGEIMERYGLSTGRNFDPQDIENLARSPDGSEALHPDAIGEDPLIHNAG